MLSEYLKAMMHVCPSIIQTIEKARIPWIHDIVSLPTSRSQIALKFVTNENDSNNSSWSAKINFYYGTVNWNLICHQHIRNFSSSTQPASAARFSSELLLFIPVGIPIPTHSFLFFSVMAVVKSYVVQFRPDESECNSFAYCFAWRLWLIFFLSKIS